MHVICYEEISGRTMYLTKCLGLFFWAPCKLSASQFENENIANEVIDENEKLVKGKEIKIEKAVQYIPVFVREHINGDEDYLYPSKDNSEYSLKEEFMDKLVLRFGSQNEGNNFIERRSLKPSEKHWILEYREESIKKTFINR